VHRSPAWWVSPECRPPSRDDLELVRPDPLGVARDAAQTRGSGQISVARTEPATTVSNGAPEAANNWIDFVRRPVSRSCGNRQAGKSGTSGAPVRETSDMPTDAPLIPDRSGGDVFGREAVPSCQAEGGGVGETRECSANQVGPVDGGSQQVSPR
jgi:hypothetical protein